MTVVGQLRSKPALQAILYMPAILGLIIMAGIAMRWSLADVYAIQLSHHLDTVNQDLSNKNDAQWRLASQHLGRTLELRSANARYLELAGAFNQKLELLRFDKEPLAQELGWQPNEFRALDYVRRSLRLTPSWPYLWNQLAVTKLVLKQFDDELTGAMERSLDLGPWERSVQYKLALFGLNNWPNLQDKAHSLVFQAMAKTSAMERIKSSDLYIIKNILEHPHLSQACKTFANSLTVPNISLDCVLNKI
ncbi:MAG: hypothetical protein ACR65R_18580 [Methylomicrobium sp.]